MWRAARVPSLVLAPCGSHGQVGGGGDSFPPAAVVLAKALSLPPVSNPHRQHKMGPHDLSPYVQTNNLQAEHFIPQQPFPLPSLLLHKGLHEQKKGQEKVTWQHL